MGIPTKTPTSQGYIEKRRKLFPLSLDGLIKGVPFTELGKLK